MIRTFSTLVAMLLAMPANACPFCGTPTSEQVRANIFNDSFWSNAALVAGPFPLLLVAVAALHLGFTMRSPKH
jgi:hypothetical protein